MGNPRKNLIIAALESSGAKVFRRADLASLLADERGEWGLEKPKKIDAFIEYLRKHTKLKQVVLPFPQRSLTLYTWGDISMYQILQELFPDGFLSHYTAMRLHHLVTGPANCIYFNRELPPIFQNDTPLSQEAIDRAFASNARVTKQLIKHGRYTVYLLSSKHTDRLGIIEINHPGCGAIHLTGLERTLIDAAVRPFYSGGVKEVLKAYAAAAGKVSPKALADMLQQTEYRYPYHQAIGFYLDKSRRYSKAAISQFREQFDIENDFYLDYGMKEKQYCAEWRIFFPKGM